MITSKFLSIHTDVNRLKDLPSWLKPTHPNWIGAWWLPFLTFGFTALIMALVIFMFPRKIIHKQVEKPNSSKQNGKEVELTALTEKPTQENGHAEVEETRDYEPGAHTNNLIEEMRDLGSSLSINQLGKKSKNYKAAANNGNGTAANGNGNGATGNGNMHLEPEKTDDTNELTLIQKSILLFKRPVYLFVIISSAIEGLLQNSFLAFATLFLEYQYRLASGSASLILGLLSIPPLMIGGILSGLIVKKLKNKTSHCFKFLAIVIFVNIIVYAGFMIYCREANMISNDPSLSLTNNYVTSNQCQCNSKIFKPICLKDSDDIFFQVNMAIYLYLLQRNVIFKS